MQTKIEKTKSKSATSKKHKSKITGEKRENKGKTKSEKKRNKKWTCPFAFILLFRFAFCFFVFDFFQAKRKKAKKKHRKSKKKHKSTSPLFSLFFLFAFPFFSHLFCFLFFRFWSFAFLFSMRFPFFLLLFFSSLKNIRISYRGGHNASNPHPFTKHLAGPWPTTDNIDSSKHKASTIQVFRRPTCSTRLNKWIKKKTSRENPIPFNFDSPQASWPQVMNSSSTFHHTWPEGADLSWPGGTSKPSVAWLGEVFWFCVLHPEKWHEMHVPRLPFTAYAFSKLNFLEDWDVGHMQVGEVEHGELETTRH